MQPPVAPRRPHLRTLFGDPVEDPYFWMRDREDPELLAYLAAENAYASAATAHLEPLVARLYDEIVGRVRQTDVSVPVRHDRWWYYSRTVEGLQYPIEARVTCADHPVRPDVDAGAPAGEEVLLDANVEAGDREYFDVAAVAVDPSGALLAYAVDERGDERYDLIVRRIDDPTQVLDDGVHGIGPELVWALDGRTVFYTRFNEAWRPYQVWRHVVGTDPGQDVLVFEEPDEYFSVGLTSSRDDRFVLVASVSKTSAEWRLLDATHPNGPPRLIAARRPGVEYDVEVAGDRLLIVHNAERTDFSLAQAPLTATGPSDWVPLDVLADDEYLLGVDAFAGFAVLTLRRGGLRRLRILPREDSSATGFGEPHDIAWDDEELFVAGVGSTPQWDSTSVQVVCSSLVTPAGTFDYHPARRELELLKREPVLGGYRREDYQQHRVWATAPDGTRVPVSLVCHVDTPRDGTAGGLLYGYGAYGHALEPSFGMTRRALSLLDRGYVFAIAHVRGGSELGRAWYDDGKMTHKMNSFTDFIACARALVDGGWVAPDRLAALGGSAGGLLMGAVATMAPERFAVVHAAVPFVDALNTICDETLPLTVTEWEEWGDAPHDPAAYAGMKGYTPYENVAPRRYPALLVTADLHDTRVYVTEPAKWVAKMRATCGPESAPVLFRTNMSPSSHLGQSGRYDAWRRQAWEDAVTLDLSGWHESP